MWKKKRGIIMKKESFLLGFSFSLAAAKHSLFLSLSHTFVGNLSQILLIFPSIRVVNMCIVFVNCFILSNPNL